MKLCLLFAADPDEVGGVARDLDLLGLQAVSLDFDAPFPEENVDVVGVWAGDEPSVALGFCARISKEEGMRKVPLLVLVRTEHLKELFLREGVFDDFLVAPYQLPELDARVRMLLWNARQVDTGELIVCGPLKINQATYQVTADDDPLDFTYMEYELLKFLAINRGRVFTRQALLSRVWGYDYFGGTRTVDVHIRRIRAKLGDHAGIIQTIRNVGYKLV